MNWFEYTRVTSVKTGSRKISQERSIAKFNQSKHEREEGAREAEAGKDRWKEMDIWILNGQLGFLVSEVGPQMSLSMRITIQTGE